MKRPIWFTVASLAVLLAAGCTARAVTSSAKLPPMTSASQPKQLSQQALSTMLNQKIAWSGSYSDAGTIFYVVEANIPVPSNPMIKNAPDTVELINRQGKVLWNSLKQPGADAPILDGLSGFNVVKIASSNEYLVYDSYIYGAGGTGDNTYGIVTDGEHAYPFEHSGMATRLIVNSTNGTIELYDIHIDPSEDMASQGNEWNKTTLILKGSHTYTASTGSTIYSANYVNGLSITPFITVPTAPSNAY